LTENTLFPWLQPVWERLAARRAALPHALLIRGRSGLGKTLLARRFAKGLLCDRPAADGAPCNQCPACGWFEHGNHPDFRQVEPEALAAPEPGDEPPAKAESLSKQIRIDQIRALQGFLAVGTHRGGLRIVLIRPAEAMNMATANALLKSLEEPGPKTVFLLVSSDPQRLLPTIRSRCQGVEVHPAPTDAALEWLRAAGVRAPEAGLAFAGNAPLDVLEQVESWPLRERLLGELARADFGALAAADRCAGVEPAMLVETLQKWLHDLARVRLGQRPRYHPGHDNVLRQLCTTMAPRALLGFGRELARARAVVQHPLNPRLFMEDLFIRYGALREGRHA
jgi:DNA polymerase-3 subunit delta'